MKDYLEILNNNYGFVDPLKWVTYAEKHKFYPVAFQPILCCPDCGSENFKRVGQFIYYSTLHTLRECLGCGLVYVDVVIDGEVRNRHFESAYKSEDYFKNERHQIFLQTVELVRGQNIKAGTVLEVGGATGELALMLKESFSSLKIVLNDISNDACEISKGKGLGVLRGPIIAIKEIEHCSLILALDVLYYDPQIHTNLQVLYEQLEPDGVLILRLPNKYQLIRLTQKFTDLCGYFNDKKPQSRLRFFNPEHLFVLTQTYLKARLHEVGFASVKIYPSRLLEKGEGFNVSRIGYFMSLSVFWLTGKVLGPAMFVVARKLEQNRN